MGYKLHMFLLNLLVDPINQNLNILEATLLVIFLQDSHEVQFLIDIFDLNVKLSTLVIISLILPISSPYFLLLILIIYLFTKILKLKLIITKSICILCLLNLSLIGCFFVSMEDSLHGQPFSLHFATSF